MIHFAVLKAAFVSQRHLIYTNKQCWMGMPGGRGLIGRSLSARLTGQQCGAAKCGGVHTEPLPLHRPGSLPPSLPPWPRLLLSSPLGRHQRSADPTCSGSLGPGIPCSDQQEKYPVCPARQLKACLFLKRGGGSRKPVGPDGVLLPSQLGAPGSEHSRTLLKGALWVTCQPRDHRGFMGGQ